MWCARTVQDRQTATLELDEVGAGPSRAYELITPDCRCSSNDRHARGRPLKFGLAPVSRRGRLEGSENC